MGRSPRWLSALKRRLRYKLAPEMTHRNRVVSELKLCCDDNTGLSPAIIRVADEPQPLPSDDRARVQRSARPASGSNPATRGSVEAGNRRTQRARARSRPIDLAARIYWPRDGLKRKRHGRCNCARAAFILSPYPRPTALAVERSAAYDLKSALGSVQNPTNAPMLKVLAVLLPPSCALLLTLLYSPSRVRFFVSE